MAATTKYSAIAALEAKGTMQAFEFTPLPLGPNDIEVDIHACGVCHSDLHQVHNDWKGAHYPLVPGHEIIGTVITVGSGVTNIRVGQRVGVSPQSLSCNDCHECNRGAQQFCKKKLFNYNSETGNPIQPHTYGGFASHTRCDAKWVFPIPDSLPTIGAAPLLCAGLTTWSPFVHNKIKAGDRVGIIGVGGLGHIAIQFAVKLGCHTTGISTSADKKAEILGYGAQGFLNMGDAKEVAAASQSFDFLLSTISANGINWDQYFGLLRPDGIMTIVGLPSNMSFSPSKLVMNRLSLQGSLLASNKEIHEMLEFCGKHGIVAKTEERDMTPEGANQALAKVEANQARYRMVLVNRAKIPATATTKA